MSRSSPALAWLFVALAAITGSAAVLAVSSLLGAYERQLEVAATPPDTVMVIVAARDLYQGVTITEDDLFAVQIAPKYLPSGVYLSPEYVVGRVPRERILANELVRADRLVEAENGVGLNAIIPRGMRAISIEVADGPALSGLLDPGNYVDVLVTIPPEGERKEARTETLEQAVFVLGVNARTSREPDAKGRRGRSSVTLLVDMEQAERIAHAENVGDVVLVMRPDLDMAQNELNGASTGDLRDAVRGTERPVRGEKGRTVTRRCQELKMIAGPRSKTELVEESGVPCE